MDCYQVPEGKWKEHSRISEEKRREKEKRLEELDRKIKRATALARQLGKKESGSTPSYVFMGAGVDKFCIEKSLLELLTPEDRKKVRGIIWCILHHIEFEEYAREIGDDDLRRDLYYESAEEQIRLRNDYGGDLFSVANQIIERELLVI